MSDKLIERIDTEIAVHTADAIGEYVSYEKKLLQDCKQRIEDLEADKAELESKLNLANRDKTRLQQLTAKHTGVKP